MHTEAFEPRAVCMRCHRPQRVCYCAHLVSIPTRTRVVILQHPRERDMPIGTAHMATLCLPSSELHVGVDWTQSAALERALGDAERPPVLLYPGDGARDLKREPLDGACTLVVLDGTWWQARKLLRSNPNLAALPRVAFVPEKPSEYRIRKEPQDEYVSTIEALAEVLPLLEPGAAPETFATLLTPFRAMVDAQLECEATMPKVHGGLARKRLKLRKNSRMKLRERAADLVCVSVEASAWARRYGPAPAAAPEDELVYLAAHRLRTGETLALAVRPAHGLAPNTLSQTELPAHTLDAALPWADFVHHTQSFFRADDVICTWGPHATRLADVVLPPTRFDLRQIARDRAQGNVGPMGEVLQSLGEHPTPIAGTEGRAGRRLGELVGIARGLSGEAQ